jgi:predicted flavoprotein YhiN
VRSSDVVIIGAGAAGLMCGLTAAARGRTVLLIEHANKAGKKILMSGGGRCNFTNLYTDPANFFSQNPHFHKPALARYTQWDFIAMVGKHGVPYHEKKLGLSRAGFGGELDSRVRSSSEETVGRCPDHGSTHRS